MKAPLWLSKTAKTYWSKLESEVSPMTESKALQLALLCDGLATLRQANEILESEGLTSHRGLVAKKSALDQIHKSYRLLGLHKTEIKEPTVDDELSEFFGGNNQ